MWVRYDEDDTGRSREPVRLAEVLVDTTAALRSAGRPAAVAPGSGATRCRDCGAPAQWCRTVRGRWMLMEPGEQPTWRVPTGRRWRVSGDGTAVNLRAANPTDTCRVSHFDVCPARRATAGAGGQDQMRAGGRPAR